LMVPVPLPMAGVWAEMQAQVGSAVCLSNVLMETPILAGANTQGTFLLSTLRPVLDTSELRSPGEYHFRFTFVPNACVASPDASFCLMRPEKQAAVTSNEVIVQVLKPSAVDIPGDDTEGEVRPGKLQVPRLPAAEEIRSGRMTRPPGRGFYMYA
jgi:hypothetical protein